MELLCIMGTSPGSIIASVTHAGQIHQLAMTLLRHHAGGWHVVLPEGGHGPRCHSAAAAVLMQAGEALADKAMLHA